MDKKGKIDLSLIPFNLFLYFSVIFIPFRFNSSPSIRRSSYPLPESAFSSHSPHLHFSIDAIGISSPSPPLSALASIRLRLSPAIQIGAEKRLAAVRVQIRDSIARFGSSADSFVTL